MVHGSLPRLHHHVEPADRDHDQVVDDRRPHRRREPAAGVQDRPDQRAHAVEEDLRDEVVGPHHHQVVLGGQVAAGRAVDGARVQVDQRPRQQRRHHGDRQQGQRAQGEHALRVRLAAVRVALGRPDQQRHHHAGEDAAEHQVVDGVRQRVRVVVRVAEPGDADRGDQDQGAQEPGAPGDQGADRHAGAGADQARPRARARPGRPGRPRACGRATGPRGRATGPRGPTRCSRCSRCSRWRMVSGLRIPRPEVTGRPVVGRPGHAAPAGRSVHRAGRTRRGESRGPQRPGRRGRPLERQRQRGLGRAGATARHRAVQRRQRIGGGVPAVARPRVRQPRLVRTRPRRARLRRRRPSVVHRPGHPVPPSGVGRCSCLSRRYPVDPHLRGRPGCQRAATAGRHGTQR